MTEEEGVKDSISNEINADNETDTWDSSIPTLNYFDTIYTEDQFNVENKNQPENGLKTGGAIGEDNPIDEI